ncbi:MAG: FtsX-like permease family protein [Acidobacteria bacterium]|nr:FtsX-like permease family protein [Acidobacteriota bacterium]
MRRARGLPRLAAWLLTLRLPPEWRDFVLGDLEEEFQQRRGASPLSAFIWLWWQTARCVISPIQPRPTAADSSSGDSMMRLVWNDVRSVGRCITVSELRLALRLIVKQPVLSSTIVIALAIGIGLATVGFTLRDALLYGQLPFANGDRFVRLVLHSEAEDNIELDLEAYHAVRDTSDSFVHVGAVGDGEYALEAEDGTVQAIRVGLITPQSFRFLPAVPMRGRVFTAEDGAPGAEPVVLVRESLWRRRFNTSASIVGQAIQLAGVTRTVVGVLPDSFEFPASGEIWLPLDEATLTGRANPTSASLTVFGILRDGLERGGATAELSAYASAEQPGRPGSATSVLALPFTGDDDAINVVMAGLVAVLVLVLIVAASNIASLVSARTWSRSSELAVRTALGASRARLVGQLFMEVALLSATASVIGLFLAHVALDYMAAAIRNIPFWMTFDPTLRTMAFVVALAILVSVVSGLAPALAVTREHLNGALHASGRALATGGFGSVGRVLVVEVAISVALLDCALVTASALAAYVGDIPSLPKGQVLTARLNGEVSKETRDQLLAAIRVIPGVASAGVASHLPRLDPVAQPIVIEALTPDTQPLAGSAPTTQVSDGFLESVGGRTMTGRSFTANDFVSGAAPVAIVNQPFVDRFFDGRSPIGRRVQVSTDGWREIVGVVPDLGVSAADRRNGVGFYLPLPDRTLTLQIAIRVRGNPNQMAGPLRRAVADIAPTADLRSIRLLEDVGWEQRSFLSGMASAMTALGAMTLLLSVVSIYALLSFMVTRRTREIGIRVALGARGSQVLMTVAGRAFALVGVGVVLGTIVGVALAGFQSVMLIRMPDAGVTTPAIVIGGLTLATIAAAWLPTRRALAIRPSEALASE